MEYNITQKNIQEFLIEDKDHVLYDVRIEKDKSGKLHMLKISYYLGKNIDLFISKKSLDLIKFLIDYLKL
ncbi:MAG: hypothetical protein QXO99_08290 [Candidatus Methanomethylicia archaeon]